MTAETVGQFRPRLRLIHFLRKCSQTPSKITAPATSENIKTSRRVSGSPPPRMRILATNGVIGWLIYLRPHSSPRPCSAFAGCVNMSPNVSPAHPPSASMDAAIWSPSGLPDARLLRPLTNSLASGAHAPNGREEPAIEEVYSGLAGDEPPSVRSGLTIFCISAVISSVRRLERSCIFPMITPMYSCMMIGCASRMCWPTGEP